MGILLRLKRGLHSDLPLLAEGELGYTTDDKKVYIGTSAGNLEVTGADVESLDLKLDKAGGTLTGSVLITDTTESTSTTTGSLVVSGGLGVADDIHANRVFGAVYNDYAERRVVREADVVCGQVVCEQGDDTLGISDERLQPMPYVISDTYGFEIGKRVKNSQPVAVAGRVLVYVEGDKNDYQAGDVLCAAPEGKACKMTRDEVRDYPDRILGRVCSVPNYDKWSDVVFVKGRVWILI